MIQCDNIIAIRISPEHWSEVGHVPKGGAIAQIIDLAHMIQLCTIIAKGIPVSIGT